jgi:hypothetical protein
MGLFDDLFSSFTGSKGLEASQNTRSFLDDIRAETGQLFAPGTERALGYISGAQQPALSALQGGYADANQLLNTFGQSSAMYDALNKAGMQNLEQWTNRGAQEQRMLADVGAQDLRNYTDRGATAIQGGVGAANQAWAPLMQAGQDYGAAWRPASEMEANALGLNGPGGIDAATAAFRVGPGYNFMLNQGLESIARNAAKAGMVASGNMMQESQRYGSGLADQEWDDWLNRLMGRQKLYAPLEATALGQAGGGMANAAMQGALATGQLYGNAGAGLANLYGMTARDIGGMYSGMGKSMADLYGREAGAFADMFTKQGQAQATAATQLAALQSGIYGKTGQDQAALLADMIKAQAAANAQLAGAEAGTFITGANAQTQANANLWNALGNVAKTAVGLPFGSFFGGSTGGTTNVSPSEITNVGGF